MVGGMNNAWGMGNGYTWIIILVVFIVIVGLIISGVSRRKNSNKTKYNSPQDILKIRYAKGEISKDEYDEKRRHIS